MNTTKTYAAKSSVTRALKAANLNIADYNIVEVEGGFQGQLIQTPKMKAFIAAAKEMNFADTRTLAASVKPLPIGGDKKPRTGACKKVWDMADSMPGAKRSEVISACVAAGLNLGTAKTQYQLWFASKKG